jgi:hypothetical protein
VSASFPETVVFLIDAEIPINEESDRFSRKKVPRRLADGFGVLFGAKLNRSSQFR